MNVSFRAEQTLCPTAGCLQLPTHLPIFPLNSLREPLSRGEGHGWASICVCRIHWLSQLLEGSHAHSIILQMWTLRRWGACRLGSSRIRRRMPRQPNHPRTPPGEGTAGGTARVSSEGRETATERGRGGGQRPRPGPPWPDGSGGFWESQGQWICMPEPRRQQKGPLRTEQVAELLPKSPHAILLALGRPGVVPSNAGGMVCLEGCPL